MENNEKNETKNETENQNSENINALGITLKTSFFFCDATYFHQLCEGFPKSNRK